MDISTQDLEQAIAIRRQIDALEQRLASLIGRSRGGPRVQPARSPSTSASTAGKRFSAATRAKLAAAARARWARVRAGKGTTASAPKKKKGGITAAGRRRLSQLMRARWAARRKGRG